MTRFRTRYPARRTHHHPLQSVTFAVHYAMAEQPHREPPRSSDEPSARVIDGYLHAPAIPPYLLEELAPVHPYTVDDLYKVVLDRPGFRWEDDGEALLQRRKHHQYPHLDVPALFVKPRILANRS